VSNWLYFNGINGATGAYGLAPMTGEQFAAHILSIEHEQVERLTAKRLFNRTNLADAGWGVIFGVHNPLTPQIVEALEPLLRLRRSQAGELFQVYAKEKGRGYRPGDTAREFLARYDTRPSDPPEPKKMPYYLLIVGSPEEIPFQFQYQLDVQYAVGRIDFGDRLDAYANYAQSVAAAEKDGFTSPSHAAFFGVTHPDDRVTRLSTEHLVQPLYESLRLRSSGWQVRATLGTEASKARLLDLIQERPTLLFTASHGMEFPPDDPKKRQVPHQGALLCSDWPGPNAWRGEIPQDHYLAGDDLSSDTNLLGAMAFFFACYGAGTPLYDEFSKRAFEARRATIAEYPFTAALPQTMLGLPRGGALAVIGHVERAWGSSFLGPRQSTQIAVFENVIEKLLFQGLPVGLAMDDLNERYAALSTELTNLLDETDSSPDPYELAEMWTANNDARGYVVIGDPAVRLRVPPIEDEATAEL
jgi:hypothetical protein